MKPQKELPHILHLPMPMPTCNIKILMIVTGNVSFEQRCGTRTQAMQIPPLEVTTGQILSCTLFLTCIHGLHFNLLELTISQSWNFAGI
jgi:hypothetical protein